MQQMWQGIQLLKITTPYFTQLYNSGLQNIIGLQNHVRFESTKFRPQCGKVYSKLYLIYILWNGLIEILIICRK